MFNRLYNFLKNEKVLYEGQFVFPPVLFTTDILIQITECTPFVQKKITCCILFDIKELYDTTDYSKLLQNRSENGVIGVALELC